MNSNIFSLKRFGKYFRYDLLNLKNRYGLYLLIFALMPVIVYLFVVLVNLLTGNGFHSYTYAEGQIGVSLGVLLVATTFGAMTYGCITDKKAGSTYLMLPASSLEKSLSMILICCVVVPAIFFVISLGSDALLSLSAGLEPKMARYSVLSDLGLNQDTDLLSIHNLLWATWGGWCMNILTFTLGAIYFKKNKIGKTILAYMAYIIVLTGLMVLIFGKSSFGIDELMDMGVSLPRFITYLNILANAIYIIVIGGLCGGIFARIKTLKQ